MLTIKHIKRMYKYVTGLIIFKHEAVDRWYTLKACIRRGGGDCDDYRPAYWEHLLLLGIPQVDMLFLDVRVNCWKIKGAHAVLRVALNGKVYILCNVMGVMEEKKYVKKTNMKITRTFSTVEGWYVDEDMERIVISKPSEYFLFRQYQNDMGRL